MKLRVFLFALLVYSAVGCGGNPPESQRAVPFAKGADVSWLTQMESDGCSFQDNEGHPVECISLLKNLGLNAIRLRVWVNPSDGWCSPDDLLVKAERAASQGMDLMIDFHYSDWWADPGKQNKPASWENLPFDGLLTALSDHTVEVLMLLKEAGITPRWIQIGNETTNGMLWPDGRIAGENGDDFGNYVRLNNAGYRAAKSVFPSSDVMIHIDNGYDWGRLEWFFDGVTSLDADYDLIGLSLYPDKDNWQSYTSSLLDNVRKLNSRYGKNTIICEVGMNWWESSSCRAFLSGLIDGAVNDTEGHCTGVFYWEPEGYESWSHYPKCAFDNGGHPTVAMEAFRD